MADGQNGDGFVQKKSSANKMHRSFALLAIILTSNLTSFAEPQPAWNIERTLIYNFPSKQARSDAVKRLESNLEKRGFVRFTYPHDSGYGYEKRISGAPLIVNHALSQEDKHSVMTITLRGYIEDGSTKRFEAVVSEAREFFKEYDKTLEGTGLLGPYRVPGP